MSRKLRNSEFRWVTLAGDVSLSFKYTRAIWADCFPASAVASCVAKIVVYISVGIVFELSAGLGLLHNGAEGLAAGSSGKNPIEKKSS